MEKKYNVSYMKIYKSEKENFYFNLNEEVYPIYTSEKGWKGEGYFCGWHAHEFIVDATVYGYLDGNLRNPIWFEEPVHFDKLECYSIARQDNFYDVTKKEIEEGLKNPYRR